MPMVWDWDAEKDIGKKRYDWIKAHAFDDNPKCILYPYRISIAEAHYISHDIPSLPKRVGAGRIMCHVAHGPAPEGKRWAMADCAMRKDGCINPAHVNWRSMKDRMRILEEDRDSHLYD